MKPNKIEFLIGATMHRQSLRLVMEQKDGGAQVWTLHRDAANQMDDSVFISGLTSASILQMAEAVSSLGEK